ncbi:MAG: nicotinate phosphoribosyltransferase [Deltaproteobacteria bacterium]|nr:nicotinate phosphoribosyltransferase [Candidatus Tharpella sp.]
MKQVSSLLTDLYQLTMLQGYVEQSMDDIAVFEFFARKLPRGRNFFMAAGLAQVVDYLETLAFDQNDLDYLADDDRFHPDFLDYLADLRFTGDVHAMAEGTIFFPDEPIIRITAPISQAQLVESRVINVLQFQTIIASKAARMTLVAPEKLLVDFGLRRAHGAEAGLFAARASYLAGFSGTSTVLAGKMYGVPVFGTMAHSFIQAHDSETLAFEHFAESQPDNVVLLVDTYDTEKGAEKVVALAPRLAEKGITIKGVRLDSGDMILHSKNVRRILDQGGLTDVSILTSGNLDEYKLAEFGRAGAPVDGFGVGTRMTTSADAPYLDCAYKLVEYAGIARRKRSEGKATWPGRKQVFRSFDQRGRMCGDILTLESDELTGIPLVEQVMKQGKRIVGPPDIKKSREYAFSQLAGLPDYLTQLNKSDKYPVEISRSLVELAQKVDLRSSAEP